MNIKKFRMRPPGTNDYDDVLHPQTSADIVIFDDGTTVESQKLAYENFKNNVEKIRINERDRFEFFYKDKWHEIQGGGSQVPLGNVTNFTAEPDNGKVILRWKDPEDIVVDGIVISKWAGTKILRKTGSYPANENDGVLVVDSGVRNQYEIDGFVDTGLQNNVEYFYMAFPYTTDEVYTVDIENRTSAIPGANDDESGAPGPGRLIAGDMEAGYFGVVPMSELITGDELASRIGLSAGTSQFSDTAGWLKFAYNGKIQFVAKKPIRHSIGWDAINAAGCVFGKNVQIGGLTYKVRLMKTGLKDPVSNLTTDMHGSEWNKLMLPIHIKAKDGSWAYPDRVESNIPYWGIDFTDEDLLTHKDFGNGSHSWCQETYSSNRVFRGGIGVSRADYLSPGNTASSMGWRPVLELVPSTEPTDPNTWADVQDIVRQGLANEYFSVGDQLVSLYDGKEIIWEVIGIDVDTPADSNFTHSMTIQTKDCLHDIQFDAKEPNNPDSNRQSYGNNRYIHSAVRQWLNSNEPVFNWQSQHQYDAKPTSSLDLYEGAGFLNRLDPELVAVIGEVNKKVARNTVVDGGGQDNFTDKVFLLSRVEAGLGTEGDITGEFVYPFYDGIADAGRIKQLSGSNKSWWLRSPRVSSYYSVRNVRTDGSLYDYPASNALGVSPACVII